MKLHHYLYGWSNLIKKFNPDYSKFGIVFAGEIVSKIQKILEA
tara:strand:- start:804 stop:932 length:129 start_codon:yes stop_codon:yes gene_type:complete